MGGKVTQELLNELNVPCYLQVAPVDSGRLMAGDAWGAYVSHMLAHISGKPQMVLALGGGASVAEAKTGYAPNAMLRFVDLTKDSNTGAYVTFTQSQDGQALGWKKVTHKQKPE